VNEATFNDEVDDVFALVEDRIDELELDIDPDASGGLLTLSFENGTSIIFSRQPAAREIWIAAKSGGFHLAKSGDQWLCASTGEPLAVLVNRVMSEQFGEKVQVLD